MTKTVEINFAGGKKVDAEIDGTIIRTDQTRERGGENSAPQPFQLFLASIGACAGIYALGFCQSRGLSTEGMKLNMTCEFDSEDKLYKKMMLELTLPAGFPEKYRDAIVRAMNLCTVKKHIVNPPVFIVRAVPPS